MSRYFEIVKNDPAAQKALAGALAHTIEIEWNVKADPVGKFCISAEEGVEKYTTVTFIEKDTDEIFKAFKPYADNADFINTFREAWNFIKREHLMKIPGYAEYVKFYHRDEEDPQDPPTITMDEVTVWLAEYLETRK